MAKQNFLAGGYYGKLGDTVGQRWKNIRTIRSYVIPQNPRTPLQQANRKSFGGVVPYAQLGNSANFGSPAFDLSVNTQWAYRMQQGTELQRGGEQGLNLIPLYPKNFIVPHIVSGVTITEIIPNTSITFQISGDIPEEKKSYSIFLMFADGARANEIVLLNGETTDTQPTVFTCACPDTSEIDTATVYARVCSRDDERIETITASVQVLCGKDLRREFEPQFTIVEKSVATNGKVTFILETPNAYDTITSGDVRVSFGNGHFEALGKNGNRTSGTLWGFDDNLQTVNHNGKLSFTFTATKENAQKEFVSAEMNWAIKLIFTNYHTSTTNPITTTTQAETQTTWQNTQPTFALNPSFNSVGTLKDGTAYIDFNVNMPTNYATAFSAEVTVSGTVSKKDTWNFNFQTDEYQEVFVNASAMGAWSVKSVQRQSNTMRVTIQSAQWKNINTYRINAAVKLICTNAYDDNTMPSTTNFNDTARTMPNDWQPDTLRSIMQNATFTISNVEEFEDSYSYADLTWNEQVRNLNIKCEKLLDGFFQAKSGTITGDGGEIIDLTTEYTYFSISTEDNSPLILNNAYAELSLEVEGEYYNGECRQIRAVGEYSITQNVLWCDSLKALVIGSTNPIRRQDAVVNYN